MLDYVFSTTDLNRFKKELNNSNINSKYILDHISKKYGIKDIFYKMVEIYNPTLKKKTRRRVILIKQSFLRKLLIDLE